MEKKKRQYLKKSILLCGESDGGRFKRTFTIVRKVDAGASVVCYEACYENSGMGMLKEFYPDTLQVLERDKAGQLKVSDRLPGAGVLFQEMKEAYIEPYRMILRAERLKENPDLATFIPAFEIYHGCSGDGSITGTVYVWIPEPERKTFQQVCDEIHKYPQKEPEHKLVLVLNAVQSLTKCICAIHLAGMFHRDIKPSNFGFLKRGKETLTQAISLFDVDSFCSAYHVSEDVVGTKGYMEPEAGYERAGTQTDIYSIGAVLYHAVIVSEEAKKEGYLYQDAFYGELKERVNSSLLIQASEANAHPRLRSGLTRILRRCLGERDKRYSACEELLEDLDNVLYYALPSEIAVKKRSGEQWLLRDAEKALDSHAEKNSLQAIQFHLYHNPLYRWSPSGSASLNVMVIGLGNYGQKFLDICLQAGQIRGKRLNVAVISDDPADKELYLAERPELAEFFRVEVRSDGKGAEDNEDEDSYGTIFFETVSFSRNSQEENTAVLQNILCHYHERTPQYIFIALGEDALNLSAARACKEAAEILEMRCCVNFAWEGAWTEGQIQSSPGLFPVFMTKSVCSLPEYSEIERMALNVHLVWEKNLNVDFQKIKADFRKPYNHDSCTANVLSLKYKLYSMGIDLEQCSPQEAAKEFVLRIRDGSEGKKILDELAWTEHKRWVTEKLCSGWRRIRCLEDCLGGMTKDEKNKRHVCIVRSRPDQKLAEMQKRRDGERFWDEASEAERKELDDLDRMSVELHRVYAKRADEIRQQSLPGRNSMAVLGRLIEKDKPSIIAYQEWLACIKDIGNGDKQKVRLYQGNKQAFLSAVQAGLPAHSRHAVKRQIDAWEAMVYPILASKEYRDWKQNDVALINQIPFILTYAEDICMVIPFTAKQNERFANVAAATVVNPKKIIYLCYLEKYQELGEVKAALPYIAGYMQKKQIKASVEFVIAYAGALALSAGSETKAEWKRISGGRVYRLTWLYAAGAAEAAEQITGYLQRRQRGKRPFAVERNETKLSSLLLGAGFYRAVKEYQFDSAAMEFSSSACGQEFGYIQNVPYIRAADMAAFRLSPGRCAGQPEFFAGYRELWEKYHENSSVWKQLCDTLQEYACSRDKIASWKKKGVKERTGSGQALRYFLPAACHTAARKILEVLRQQGIVGPGSGVNVFTSDSYEVVIEDGWGEKSEYDKLFANVYALMQPDAVHAYLNPSSHEVCVVFNNLMVEDMPVGTRRAAEIIGLMNFLAERGYVINLRNRIGTLSFTYATYAIKDLLTKSGKMLEVYVYHKIKELGKFDDVVSSYEVEWEDTDVKSEFDCIVTKGFRSLFIECKARKEIDPNVYYRLSCLAEKFGINAKAVLIADTEEKSYYDTAVRNSMQRERGSMMNVVTVWKPEEIENIGYILLKIINGTYESDERI